jgi:hypothetical protein
VKRWAKKAERFYLGRPCLHGHTSSNGEKSLRYRSNGKCAACRLVIDRARKVAGRVQGGRKIKPEATTMSLVKYGVAPTDLTKEAQDGQATPKIASSSTPVCRQCMMPDTDNHTCTGKPQ